MSSQSLYLVPEPISPATRTSFADYPWCLQLFDNPEYVPVQTHHQIPTTRSPWGLTTVILRSHDGIRAVQSLQYCPPHSSKLSSDSEIHTLYALGAGASGQAGLLHGGLTATILCQQGYSLVTADPTMSGAHSVACNVRYFRPINIPCAVVVKARKAQGNGNGNGRKQWVNTYLEDGEGTLLAKAELLYILERNKL